MERIAGPDTPLAIKIGMPRQTTIDVADATGRFLIERERYMRNVTRHECNLRELIGAIPAFVFSNN